MQTTSLPTQLNVNAAAQRGSQPSSGGNGGSDGSQFSALLSSEMEQRQAAPAPVAPRTDAPRPQAADKPAQAADNAAPPAQTEKPADAAPDQAQQTAQTAGAKDAKPAQDGKDDDSDTTAAGQDQAKADPATAMLALMASLQPQAAAADAGTKTSGAAAAYDALTGAGAGAKGKRGEFAQLSALQQAMKGVAAKDGAADAAGTKTFAALGTPRNPALAASGAALVGDDKPALKTAAATASAADAAADLHAALAGLKGDAKAQGGTLDLALQQARDAAQAAAPANAFAAQAAAQLQPAAMEAAQAVAGAAETLSARVGTDAWENQVGQKVVWMVGSEEQTASLTLNPPDLGPMQVVLSVTGDQASVTFSANQQEVRQALENALPRLREMMSESGIALGNATVNTGMPDQRQAQQDQQPRSGSGGGWNRGNGNGNDSGATVTETTVRPARTRALGDNGMVDTFA